MTPNLYEDALSFAYPAALQQYEKSSSDNMSSTQSVGASFQDAV